MQIIECADSHLLLVVPDDSYLWRREAPMPGRRAEPKKERARRAGGREAKGTVRPRRS